MMLPMSAIRVMRNKDYDNTACTVTARRRLFSHIRQTGWFTREMIHNKLKPYGAEWFTRVQVIARQHSRCLFQTSGWSTEWYRYVVLICAFVDSITQCPRNALALSDPDLKLFLYMLNYKPSTSCSSFLFYNNRLWNLAKARLHKG